MRLVIRTNWGHINLLPTIEWRGACFLRTGDVLANRRLSADGRWVPTIAHQAAISWLTNLLFGGSSKTRYTGDSASRRRGRHRVSAGPDRGGGRKVGSPAVGGCQRGPCPDARPPGRPRSGAPSGGAPAPGRPCARSDATSPTCEPNCGFASHLPCPGMPFSARTAAARVPSCTSWFVALRRVRMRTSSRSIGAPRLVARSHGAELVTAPHARPNRGALASTLRLGILGADWIVRVLGATGPPEGERPHPGFRPACC